MPDETAKPTPSLPLGKITELSGSVPPKQPADDTTRPDTPKRAPRQTKPCKTKAAVESLLEHTAPLRITEVKNQLSVKVASSTLSTKLKELWKDGRILRWEVKGTGQLLYGKLNPSPSTHPGEQWHIAVRPNAQVSKAVQKTTTTTTAAESAKAIAEFIKSEPQTTHTFEELNAKFPRLPLLAALLEGLVRHGRIWQWKGEGHTPNVRYTAPDALRARGSSWTRMHAPESLEDQIIGALDFTPKQDTHFLQFLPKDKSFKDEVADLKDTLALLVKEARIEQWDAPRATSGKDTGYTTNGANPKPTPEIHEYVQWSPNGPWDDEYLTALISSYVNNSFHQAFSSQSIREGVFKLYPQFEVPMQHFQSLLDDLVIKEKVWQWATDVQGLIPVQYSLPDLRMSDLWHEEYKRVVGFDAEPYHQPTLKPSDPEPLYLIGIRVGTKATAIKAAEWLQEHHKDFHFILPLPECAHMPLKLDMVTPSILLTAEDTHKRNLCAEYWEQQGSRLLWMTHHTAKVKRSETKLPSAIREGIAQLCKDASGTSLKPTGEESKDPLKPKPTEKGWDRRIWLTDIIKEIKFATMSVILGTAFTNRCGGRESPQEEALIRSFIRDMVNDGTLRCYTNKQDPRRDCDVFTLPETEVPSSLYAKQYVPKTTRTQVDKSATTFEEDLQDFKTEAEDGFARRYRNLVCHIILQATSPLTRTDIQLEMDKNTQPRTAAQPFRLHVALQHLTASGDIREWAHDTKANRYCGKIDLPGYMQNGDWKRTRLAPKKTTVVTPKDVLNFIATDGPTSVTQLLKKIDLPVGATNNEALLAEILHDLWQEFKLLAWPDQTRGIIYGTPEQAPVGAILAPRDIEAMERKLLALLSDKPTSLENLIAQAMGGGPAPTKPATYEAVLLTLIDEGMAWAFRNREGNRVYTTPNAPMRASEWARIPPKAEDKPKQEPAEDKDLKRGKDHILQQLSRSFALTFAELIERMDRTRTRVSLTSYKAAFKSLLQEGHILEWKETGESAKPFTYTKSTREGTPAGYTLVQPRTAKNIQEKQVVTDFGDKTPMITRASKAAQIPTMRADPMRGAPHTNIMMNPRDIAAAILNSPKHDDVPEPFQPAHDAAGRGHNPFGESIEEARERLGLIDPPETNPTKGLGVTVPVGQPFKPFITHANHNTSSDFQAPSLEEDHKALKGLVESIEWALTNEKKYHRTRIARSLELINHYRELYEGGAT